jgi:anti-sigma B factor antagonist
MSGMRARGWRRQGGIMGVTLCVRPGDGGIIVAISGEVDVCTEAPLQQALLRIIRERSARLMLDVSGVSFMDCAGLRALPATRRRGGFMRLIATSAAVRRIIELTGTHEALAAGRSTTDRSVQFFLNERTGCDAPQKCPPAFRTSAGAA